MLTSTSTYRANFIYLCRCTQFFSSALVFKSIYKKAIPGRFIKGFTRLTFIPYPLQYVRNQDIPLA